MDVCGEMCGVRYSQINPHRTLKQVREFEAKQQQQNEKLHIETHPNQEKTIN